MVPSGLPDQHCSPDQHRTVYCKNLEFEVQMILNMGKIKLIFHALNGSKLELP